MGFCFSSLTEATEAVEANFSYHWKIVGPRPTIFNGTPGNFEAYYTGIDLKVKANLRLRLRFRLIEREN